MTVYIDGGVGEWGGIESLIPITFTSSVYLVKHFSCHYIFTNDKMIVQGTIIILPSFLRYRDHTSSLAPDLSGISNVCII
jgi:hypothetical protein